MGLNMLKAKTGNNILLGVDKENIKRLTEGKPIRVEGKELGIPYDIFIIYGETLKDIARELNLPQIN